MSSVGGVYRAEEGEESGGGCWKLEEEQSSPASLASPASPAWLELGDWLDYGGDEANIILDDIHFIIKEEPDFGGDWTDSVGGEGGPVAPLSPPSSDASSGCILGVVPPTDYWPTSPATAEAEEGAKTSELLQEFEDVLSRALTPPDSPVSSAAGLVCPGLHQPPQSSPVSFYHQEHQPLHHQSTPAGGDLEERSSSVTEIDAIVNESFTHAALDYSSSSDSGYDDPDWNGTTAALVGGTTSTGRYTQNTTAGSSNRGVLGGGGRSSSRPYPSIEERKARKKEQNKNAATRYRQKKKQEIEVILSEEKGLQDKNDTLRAEVEEIQREMKYLKSLLRHMFKAKGMIR